MLKRPIALFAQNRAEINTIPVMRLLLLLAAALVVSAGRPVAPAPAKAAVSGTKRAALRRLPDGVKNGLASGLAAAFVKIILQPIDTIKTVQQATQYGMGPLKAASEVVKTRGVLGLWSGVGITVLGSSPSVAVYFGVYSSVKKCLTGMLRPDASQFTKLLAVAAAASCGNTVASVLRAPYEVLKQRVQAGEHATAWEAMRHSLKVDGPLGLFSKGKLSSQIFRDVPYAIVTLVSYEILQGLVKKAIAAKKQAAGATSKKTAPQKGSSSLLEKLNEKPALDAFCGALAGGTGSLFTTPMDVIKTRMMTGESGRYKSVVDAIRVMYRDEGVASFFIGTLPRLAHKVPANGLFFLCYEAFRSWLGVV